MGKCVEQKDKHQTAASFFRRFSSFEYFVRASNKRLTMMEYYNKTTRQIIHFYISAHGTTYASSCASAFEAENRNKTLNSPRWLLIKLFMKLNYINARINFQKSQEHSKITSIFTQIRNTPFSFAILFKTLCRSSALFDCVC